MGKSAAAKSTIWGRLVSKIRFFLPITALVWLSLAAAAPSAPAAQITLGPSLTTAGFTTFGCGGGTTCAYAQVVLPGGLLASSPTDGAIVSWSIKGAVPLPGYALQVVSPTEHSFTALETSAPQAPAGAEIETFATSLPIKAGQYLAVDTPNGGAVGYVNMAGAHMRYVIPAPADGETAFLPGESTVALGLSAEIQPAPRITAISPPSGPVTGGTSVLIAGSDFERVATVKFGTSLATSFTVNSEGAITAIAPPGIGAVPVSVTTIAGTAASVQSFTYVAAPPTCEVPNLQGKKLKASKKKSRLADCKVGAVLKKKGASAKTGKVVKQSPKAGKVLPAGTKIKVVLGS